MPSELELYEQEDGEIEFYRARGNEIQSLPAASEANARPFPSELEVALPPKMEGRRVFPQELESALSAPRQAAVRGVFLLFGTYYKVPPNIGLIISGPRGTRVASGRSAFVRLTETAKPLSLEVIAANVFGEEIRSREAIPLDIKAIVQFKVNSDNATAILTAAESFLSRSPEDIGYMVKELLKGHLRDICANMTAQEIYADRRRLQEHVLQASEPDLEKLGLAITSFVIKDIGDPQGYFAYKGVEKLAEEWKRARRKATEAYQESEEIRAGATENVARVWKDTHTSMEQFRAEVAAERSRAEMAGPIEKEELEIELARKKATVRELVGEAERLYKIKCAMGEEERITREGSAIADAEKAMVNVYAQLDESARAMNVVMKALPDIIGQMASPLSKIEPKIWQIDFGEGKGIAAPFLKGFQELLSWALPTAEKHGALVKDRSKESENGSITAVGKAQELVDMLLDKWESFGQTEQETVAKAFLDRVPTKVLEGLKDLIVRQ